MASIRGLLRGGKGDPGGVVQHTVGNALVLHAEDQISAEAQSLALSVVEDTENDVVVLDLGDGMPIGSWESMAGVLPRRRRGIRLVACGRHHNAAAMAGQWLSERLNRTVIAPDGDLVRGSAGGLFVHSSPGSGWVRFRPGKPPTWDAKRYPTPLWDKAATDKRASSSTGEIEPLPGGVWIHDVREAATVDEHRQRLIADVPCQPEVMTVLLGCPGTPPLSLDDVVRFWRDLDPDSRLRTRFVQYGDVRLPEGEAFGQALADLLGTQVICYTGVPVGAPGKFEIRTVRADGVLGWPPFALELGYAPRAHPNSKARRPAVLSHRGPLRWTEEISPRIYWYAPDAVVEVVQAGLWVRAVDEPANAERVRATQLDPEGSTLIFDDTMDERTARMRELAEDLAARVDPSVGQDTALFPASVLVPGQRPAGRAEAQLRVIEETGAPVVARARVEVPAPPQPAATIMAAPSVEAVMIEPVAEKPQLEAYGEGATQKFSRQMIQAYVDTAPEVTQVRPTASAPAPAPVPAAPPASSPRPVPPAAPVSAMASMPVPVPAPGVVTDEPAPQSQLPEPAAVEPPAELSVQAPVQHEPTVEPVEPVTAPVEVVGGPVEPVRPSPGVAEPVEVAVAPPPPVQPSGLEEFGVERLHVLDPQSPPAAVRPAAVPSALSRPEAPRAAVPEPAVVREVAGDARMQPIPAPSASALLPKRSLDEERAWLRRTLSRDFDVMASSVSRIMSEHPGLQATGAVSPDSVLADSVAVRLYLSQRGAGIDDGLRTGANGPHVPFARCTVSGLSRLPSFRGTTVYRTSPTAAEWDAYRDRRIVTDWAFVNALTGPCTGQDGDTDVLVWSMTARRTGVLEPEGDDRIEDRVLFLPGTHFKILELRQPTGDERGAVLMREIGANEIGSDGRVDPDRVSLDELAATSLRRSVERWSTAEPKRRIGAGSVGRFGTLPGLTGPAPARSGPPAGGSPVREEVGSR
ncbi:hypothetical protein [Actinoplanes sp. NPDC051494]|uniref:hypothetical protein n=1 Tax=Actinoplanes sp. NPDC051494 TaxID=3363907 RepID=UPI0037A4F9CF